MEYFFVFAALFPLLSFNLLPVSTARDTITSNQSIADGETVISSGGAFELGFFNPNPSSSKNRYVGIWYKAVPVQTVVWVANRDAPLTSSAGVLVVTGAGNLALHDGAGHLLWSTNTSSDVSNPVAQLLDSGNLVLTDGSESVVWQSFDHPSDTLVPNMKLGWDLTTHLDWRLKSWKSSSDPSPGSYTCRMDLFGELYITNGSTTEFRSKPWDGRSWAGGASDPPSTRNLITYQFVFTADEAYYSYKMMNSSVISRLVLNSSGVLQRLVWQSQRWVLYWTIPRDECDQYAKCGAYGVCSSTDSPSCHCLRGFVPKLEGDQKLGCMRRTALNCEEGDGFVQVSGVKLPEMSNATVDRYIDFNECRDGCLKNCSCMAFAFLNEGTGCFTWHGDLIDARELSAGAGEDIYVRLAASELDAGSKRHVSIIVIITCSLASLTLSIIAFFVWMRRCRRKGLREVMNEQSQFALHTTMTMHRESNESPEISLFPFSIIVDATNNFSDANKLGEGGFGCVFKGKLSEGQEIAVKRLATCSGQGLEEFKNEILLIAKLQHRNLVKILGCCIQGEEKILIYEYMPNKSLDSILFDPAKRAQLDWGRRFNIIEGITQGLLYLHKHSRLRVIHRDLKASNILLDAELNPKISDFGMARIFSANETQANTIRVVGTYGYMSPEYVTGGLFSIKSDIFSFGVILLEIISGKRNIGFQHDNFLNLLGYAWALWREARWFEIVDPSLNDASHASEICRCIHVALMCVQERAIDRPTISEVTTMLSNESTTLPIPKQPPFFHSRITTEVDSSSNILDSYSMNAVTISVIDGR